MFRKIRPNRITSSPALIMMFALSLAISTIVQAGHVLPKEHNPTYFSIGAGKEYTLIQMGNNGLDGTGGQLSITSNSSIFGSTLKGNDSAGDNKLTSNSQVTGKWDRETGVTNDTSSSQTGSQSTLSTIPTFNNITDNILATSSYWASQTHSPADDIDINLNGTTKTITGTTGGANIFNVTDGFILNSGAKLILTGGIGDYFVFNIPEDQYFSIQSSSIIELGGDILASEVLYNVLGSIGSDDINDDEALISGSSIFQGTLLAPGRKVTISQNHFWTHNSTNPFLTTPTTASLAIEKNEAGDSKSAGLWGQIISGGEFSWSESDIADNAFCVIPPDEPEMPEVPEPGSIAIWSILGLTGFITRCRRKKLKAETA